MKNIQYFETHSTDPAYNLAFEEYIFSHFLTGDILILWQNDNAVIVGRNQNTEEEIHKGFVEQNEIRVIRRNTGGGAVYHDLGNLNFSYITNADGIDQTAVRSFLAPIVSALRNLGLDAAFSGRNDILICDKKVSGIAQQLSHGRLLLHGTMLFDSDVHRISGALNPDPTKFQSKSIKSVRSRIGNIRSFLKEDMDLPAFWGYLKRQLLPADALATFLTAEDLTGISQLTQDKYSTWQWNYGKSPKFDMQRKKRLPGGLLDIRLHICEGKIKQIRIFGDFLSQEPVAVLEDTLVGCYLQEASLHQALSTMSVSPYLGSISAKQLIHTILNLD